MSTLTYAPTLPRFTDTQFAQRDQAVRILRHGIHDAIKSLRYSPIVNELWVSTAPGAMVADERDMLGDFDPHPSLDDKKLCAVYPVNNDGSLMLAPSLGSLVIQHQNSRVSLYGRITTRRLVGGVMRLSEANNSVARFVVDEKLLRLFPLT